MNNTLNQKHKKNATTYHEVKIGKTLYRVTNVFNKEIELGRILEDLTVTKVLQAQNHCS